MLSSPFMGGGGAPSSLFMGAGRLSLPLVRGGGHHLWLLFLPLVVVAHCCHVVSSTCCYVANSSMAPASGVKNGRS